MFEFVKGLATDKAEAEIYSAKVDILCDEYPVLYTGLNSYGRRVLGSYVSRDDEADDDVIYFIHFITTDNLFKAFENETITYRDLLESAKELYIVKKNYDNKSVDYYMITAASFPEAYLPAVDSFYPKPPIVPGFGYTLRLTGKLADQNKVDANEGSHAALEFSAFLFYSINLLKGPKVKILQRPSSDGSFKFNFEVAFQAGSQLSIDGEKAVIDFQAKFISYCTDKLLDEVHTVFAPESNLEQAVGFVELREEFKFLRNALGKRKKKNDEGINILLKKDVAKSLHSLSNSISSLGNSFDGIEISNQSVGVESGVVLSAIDAEVKSRIDFASLYIESLGKDFEEDDSPMSYRLAIYNLNTDTRTGNAIIFSKGDKPVLSKPRVKILGDAPLENTNYTNSLHKGEMIDIIGKARRAGNKFLSIEISND